MEERKIRGGIDTILTTALLRSARILRRVLETVETCNLSDLSESPPANEGVKNSQGMIKLIIASNLSMISW